MDMDLLKVKPGLAVVDLGLLWVDPGLAAVDPGIEGMSLVLFEPGWIRMYCPWPGCSSGGTR